MTDFPSRKIMLGTILLLLLWFLYSFLTTSKSQFSQLSFDWDNKTAVTNEITISIDSLSYNYIKFSSNGVFNPNPKYTYQFKTNGEPYYFRYAFSTEENGKMSLTGVEWITGVPDKSVINATISGFKIPMLKNNGPNVVTLGNEMLLDNEAKYFRKTLFKEKKINFLGRNTDVYNFSNESYYGASPYYFIAKIDSVPIAEIYIIGFDSRLKSDSPKDTAVLGVHLVDLLLKRQQTQHVVYLLLPSSTNSIYNAYNIQFNKALKEHGEKEKLILLPTESIFSENKVKYMLPDGTAPSAEGYIKLAKEVLSVLK